MKAHQLIQKYGWLQGDRGSKYRGFCLLDAIDSAYSNKVIRKSIQGELCKLLRLGVFSVVGSGPVTYLYGEALAKWNDHVGRKASKVIAALKRIESP